mmetsp:Transcript_110805/g.196310  ORF Transcript_110805/g.196310 Transcript_110805/m.196310 type:complete len:151 (-) Transcript_110805:168-620(-)
MKPDFDALGETYADSASILIGDVDCTAGESEGLCTRFDIKGYPTLKYFNDEHPRGETYAFGREYEEMNDFVKEHLTAKCNIDTREACDAKELAFILKWSAKDYDKLGDEVVRLQSMKNGPMKEDKKIWIEKRVKILMAIAAKGKKSNEEL